MDKDTRNRIQHATQAARKLLEGEFAAQLEGSFDIRPDGTVAVEPGRHLAEDTDALRVRAKLVEAVAHHRALGEKPADAVKSVLRASAFTTLNRFVALKMLESRKIVQECVTKGLESSGFKNEFLGLADGLKVQPDAAYKLYLECLFDEIGREVRVLFDRRDPASLLWPRRTALEELLGIVNDPELAAVWGEDETIGWVYQYFNGEDERRQMRAESQAPRNSRELAVRNQFFTPRYVVEFLTDNTLGRTWVEMQRGETRLMEQCRYLVRRPSEVFLRQGEVAPPEDESVPVEQRTVYVPFRAKKDPREIRVLDPACGSGHFLLYSFDLLLAIYEEAWADAELGGLRRDFATVEALRLALPGLILRYNLHGVDIDPRAAQIAAMALWMRAQRAWNDFGVRRADRPLVTRTNVVVAEPMPGERDLLEEFCRSLAPEVAGLVRQVFEDMQLAGEAGTLLRIEETVQGELRKRFGRGGLFAKQDAEQWADVEQQVYEALRGYAEQVPGGAGYRRRLFAEDAARGFAFIDVSRKRYDVVLMNPPFGEFVDRQFAWLGTNYPTGKRDLAAAFTERGADLCVSTSSVFGVLLSRKALFLDTQSEWREQLLSTRSLNPVADLGHKVLDNALVEVAALCFQSNKVPNQAICLLADDDKEAALIDAIGCVREGSSERRHHVVQTSSLRAVPGLPFAYSASSRVLEVFRACEPMDPEVAACRKGLNTSDDTRFLRLAWELAPSRELGQRWVTLAKGGEYQPFYAPLDLVLLWEGGYGQMAAFNEALGNEAQSRRGSRFYFSPGLTYTERTVSKLSVRLLPAGSAFTGSGPGIIPSDAKLLLPLLGLLNSRVFNGLYELCIGGGDSVSSGAAARHYTQGSLGRMPVPSVRRLTDCAADAHVLRLIELAREDSEELRYFDWGSPSEGSGIEQIVDGVVARTESRFLEAMALSYELERTFRCAYDLSSEAHKSLDDLIGQHPCEYTNAALEPAELATVSTMLSMAEDALVDHVAVLTGNPPHIALKAYVWSRRYELICHALRRHPSTVVAARQTSGKPPPGIHDRVVASLLEFGILECFGLRWSMRRQPVPEIVTPTFRQGPAVTLESTGPAILSEDPGTLTDLLAAFRGLLAVNMGENLLREVDEQISSNHGSLRHWLRTQFFRAHISRTSAYRRTAPIIWQLGTESADYSVWVSYHRFNKDTLHRVLNDHVAPKLRYESGKLAALQSEGGPSPSPSQRRALADQETFVDELRALQDELDRVAPLWDPDLDDGVVINASFLHRLFAHTRAWQRECESHWQKLQKGEYDWAHLAMRLWPERVVPKCTEDRSLAIAHGLEDALWLEGTDGKWRPQPVTDEQIAALVQERTSTAVKDALRRMGETPEPVAARKVRAAAPVGEPKPPKKAKVVKVPEGLQLGLGLGNDPTATELNAVRAALHSADDGLPKAELLAACGLDEDAGAAALAALVQTGEVVKIGAGRGTRYRLGGEG